MSLMTREDASHWRRHEIPLREIEWSLSGLSLREPSLSRGEVYEAAGPTTTTTSMSYSSANELTSSTTGAVTTVFAYDAWGRMTS